jgi:predicted protein tyrosine phosphatase
MSTRSSRADFTSGSECRLHIPYVASHSCMVLIVHLTSIMAARSSRSLSERRISHILSVCSDAIPAELPESGITHMRISVEDVDYADLLIHLPHACNFIDHALRSQGVVLVHCVQGLSRSAAVIAAYRTFIHFIFNLPVFTFTLCQ